MAPPSEYRVFAVGGIPEVVEGDDLAELIDNALTAQETPLVAGDVLLVTQKIVSKAEGRVIRLDDGHGRRVRRGLGPGLGQGCPRR